MTALDAPPRKDHPPTTTRPRLNLTVMCLAGFMIQVDVTIVNVALPRIQAGLQLNGGGLLWVVTAYALSLAACIPVAAALGDRFGHRPVFLTGVAVFTVASVGCALAGTGLALVIARAAQGAGGAAMLALTLSIITESYTGDGRAGAIGTWAAVGGTGFGVGPVVGGLLLSVTGWSSVFWVNVPVGIFAFVGALVAVPRSHPSEHRLDVLGATLCAGGLVALSFGLTRSSAHPWSSLLVAGPVLSGVALLLAFSGWQRRAAYPMAPPALLRIRGFAPAVVVYLAAYAAFGGILFFCTLLYQDVAGWSVLRTGLSWLFMNVPFLVVAQCSAALQRRLSARTQVTAGCLGAAAGAATLTVVTVTTPFAVTAVAFVLAGAGFGALVPVLTHVAMAEVPSRLSGIASGLLNSARQVGTSIGLAVLGYVAAARTLSAWHRLPGHLARAAEADVVSGRVSSVGHALGSAYRQPAVTSFEQGYHWAVGVGAVLLALGAAVAWCAFPTRAEPVESTRAPSEGGLA
ncbi:MFS transporter [Flexivirga alba]|uniref:MFS transporter n=1 Tax=Flexivirga alba TaxID=702742 RepID=A0ABW2AHF6_9MICO